MPFGAWKYRDACAQLDTGLFNKTVTAQSASTVSTNTSGSPLLMFGSNNFHKVIYRLYVNSAVNTNNSLNIYYWAASSITTSSGSGANSTQPIANLWSTSTYSSVSSYWSQADSANFTVSLASSAAVSTSNTILVLDLRPEKFSNTWNVILPVVQTANASASTVTTAFTVTGDAYLTDFQPASNYDSSTINVVETDYF